MKKLKLIMELVPEPCWNNNLRNLLGQTKWRRVRYDVIYKAGGRCEICGDVPDKLECHERWHYDDKKHVQTLKGFIALCYMCHSIKHIGFAFVRLWNGLHPDQVMNGLVEHFMKVNKCKKSVFFDEIERVFELQNERNTWNWKTVMDDFLPKKMPMKKRTIYIGGKRIK